MSTILIYRLGSLGDTVLCLPCLHRVAERFPNSRRIVLTNKPISKAAPRLFDVLAGSDLVHGAIEYRLGTRSPIDLGRLFLQLKATKAEALVYLTAARGQDVVSRDLKFFRASGIKKIIGAPVTSDLQENRLDPATGEEEQECARLTRTIAELGPIDLDDRRYWDLHLTDVEKKSAHDVLQPLQGKRFLAVNMGGKSAQNDWGERNWQILVADLHQRFDELCVVFVGSEKDAERAQAVAAQKPQQSLNLCGKLKPRESAAVLQRAGLFAGHDSGPLHLAAACNISCVGIYSDMQKARKWHPYGTWHRIFHPHGPISLVPVDSVRDAVIAGLSNQLSRRR